MGAQQATLSVLGSGLDGNEVDKDDDYFEVEADCKGIVSTKPNDFYFYIYEKNGLQTSYCDKQLFPTFENKKIVKLETKGLLPGRTYYVKWFHGNQSHGDLMGFSEEFVTFSSQALSKRQYDESNRQQREAMLKRSQAIAFHYEEAKKARKDKQRRDALIMNDKQVDDESLSHLNIKKRKAGHISEMTKEMYKISVADRKVFKKYFDLIDCDLNGEIDFLELSAYFSKVGDFTSNEVKLLMEQADLNHDNVIRLDEFIAIARVSIENPRANKSPAWDRLVEEVQRSYHEVSPRARLHLPK